MTTPKTLSMAGGPAGGNQRRWNAIPHYGRARKAQLPEDSQRCAVYHASRDEMRAAGALNRMIRIHHFRKAQMQEERAQQQNHEGDHAALWARRSSCEPFRTLHR